jgi:hypothetical protein
MSIHSVRDAFRPHQGAEVSEHSVHVLAKSTQAAAAETSSSFRAYKLERREDYGRHVSNITRGGKGPPLVVGHNPGRSVTVRVFCSRVTLILRFLLWYLSATLNLSLRISALRTASIRRVFRSRSGFELLRHSEGPICGL